MQIEETSTEEIITYTNNDFLQHIQNNNEQGEAYCMHHPKLLATYIVFGIEFLSIYDNDYRTKNVVNALLGSRLLGVYPLYTEKETAKLIYQILEDRLREFKKLPISERGFGSKKPGETFYHLISEMMTALVRKTITSCFSKVSVYYGHRIHSYNYEYKKPYDVAVIVFQAIEILKDYNRRIDQLELFQKFHEEFINKFKLAGYKPWYDKETPTELFSK